MIMVDYLRVGIVVVLACSFTACQSTNVQEEARSQLIHRKLVVVARCVQVLVDSIEPPPSIYINVYRETGHLKKISIPNEIIDIIDRSDVQFAGRYPARPGVSSLAVFLDRLDYKENGIISFVISENYSLSLNYVHSFLVTMEQGNVVSVEIEGSIVL